MRDHVAISLLDIQDRMTWLYEQIRKIRGQDPQSYMLNVYQGELLSLDWVLTNSHVMINGVMTDFKDIQTSTRSITSKRFHEYQPPGFRRG